MIETKPTINCGNRGQLFRATWLSSARCSASRDEGIFVEIPSSRLAAPGSPRMGVAKHLGEKNNRASRMFCQMHVQMHVAFFGYNEQRTEKCHVHLHVHLAEHSTRSVVLLNRDL